MKTIIQAFLAKFYEAVIIVLTAFLLLALIGFGVQSWRVSHWKTTAENADLKCKQDIAKIKDQQLEALAKKQSEINQVSTDYEKAKSEQRVQVETVIREVQKIIERPVYFNKCFDDDGMQQLNLLIASGTGESP